MPTWGQILAEIQTAIKNNDPAAFDTVRNKYLKELSGGQVETYQQI